MPSVHGAARGLQRVAELPLELLGLKEKRGLELELKKLSAEELKLLHQSQSFKIGSALTGVFINGMLTCVFPSNAVGATLNLRQLYVAIHTRRKIEKTAREDLDVDFRKEDEHISRIRHYFYGGASKTAFSVLFLGQADFLELFFEGADLDLFSPDVEDTILEASEEHFDNVAALLEVSGLPAQEVLDAFGMEDNPTWEVLQQSSCGVTEEIEVGLGIGAAAEANIPMLLGEAVAEKAHTEIIRGTERMMGHRHTTRSRSKRRTKRSKE